MDIENKYGTLEMQRYYMPLLDYVDDICRKNDIKYTISDGSLIGAVRHGGFVPWDDDIDISFDRQNYEKFLGVIQKCLGEEYTLIRDLWVYRLSRKDNLYINEIPPEGCIDFFVFDNVPDNKIADKAKSFLLKMLQGMLKKEENYGDFSLSYKIMLFATHLLGKLFSRYRMQKWYDKVAQWGNKCETQKKARYYCSFRYLSKVRYDCSVTDGYTEIEFEGKPYMALQHWDDFLKADYGDYMKLPPEDKRIPKHIH